MANLIDESYFIGDIVIPNTNKDYILENLNWFITKYQQDCLSRILGEELYRLFIATPTDGRYDLILTGVDYTVNGKQYYWDGLVNSTDKLSLIANYVYWFIQRSNATHTTGVAIAKVNPAASVSVSPGEKMVAAWNWFSRQSYQLCFFLRNYKDDGILIYPEFNVSQDIRARNFSRPINVFGL